MELRNPTIEELEILLKLADNAFHKIQPHIDPNTMQISANYIEMQNTLSNVDKFVRAVKKNHLEKHSYMLEEPLYNVPGIEESIPEAGIKVKHRVKEFGSTNDLNKWFDIIPTTCRILQIILEKVNVNSFSETTYYTVHYVELEHLPEPDLSHIFRKLGEEK